MKYKVLIFAALLTSITISISQSQQDTSKSKLVQLTGLIVQQGDSLYGIPGAHIFNPKTGRGATSNLMGYFSLAAKPGDSLMIACIGFMRQEYVVPGDSIESYTLIFEMKDDTIKLPEIRIDRLPTERVFKKAFLALNLPEDDFSNASRNLDRQMLINLYGTADVDPSILARYNMQQQAQIMEQRYASQSIALLDPFAWARFVKDVKAEKRKKEQWETETEQKSGY